MKFIAIVEVTDSSASIQTDRITKITLLEGSGVIPHMKDFALSVRRPTNDRAAADDTLFFWMENEALLLEAVMSFGASRMIGLLNKGATGADEGGVQ